MSRLTDAFVPSVEFVQQFVRDTVATTRKLSPFIFGSIAQLVRYAVPGEKAKGLLGQYLPNGLSIEGNENNAYAWPNKAIGSTIDANYTRLYVENALLKYWESSEGDIVVLGSNKLAAVSTVFASVNNSFPVSEELRPRGVRIGDRVLVRGVDSNDEDFELATYVQGFTANLSGSDVEPAISASSNQPDVGITAATVTEPVKINMADLTASANAYNGFSSGRMSETYRLECIKGSVGGNTAACRFRVTTNSGTDNVASQAAAAVGTSFDVGTRGLKAVITLDEGAELEVGDVFVIAVSKAYSVPSLTISGDYNAKDYRDRVYIVEVLAGNENTSSSTIQISEASGADISQVKTVIFSSSESQTIAIGSYGLSLQFEASYGLVTGDKWTVLATAAKPVEIKTLVLAHSIPSNVARDDSDVITSVSLFIHDTMEIPHRSVVAGEHNFDISNDRLLVRAGIQLEHPDWVDDSGNPVPLDLSAPAAFNDSKVSQLYVTYRAWLPRSSGLLTAITTSEVDTLIPGANHPDNPLKYAMKKATPVAQQTPVYWFNVGDPTVEANWIAAVQTIDRNRNIHGVVPLTSDPAILDKVGEYVATRNSPRFNMFRAGWLTTDITTNAVAVLNAELSTDNSTVMAIITDNEDIPGDLFNVLTITSGNASLIDLGVRAGDVVRFNFAADAWGKESYRSFTVAAVVSEDSLLLSTGADFAETVPRRVEIVRNPTGMERVAMFQQQTAAFALASDGLSASLVGAKYTGYLFRMMPFGTVYDGTLEVPSYHMMAVFAAARGALAPQQPMTRMAVPGFSGVKGLELFTEDELNELAASGAWIVAPSPTSNSLIVRHAVTMGEWDNVNTREESCISNLHSINNFMFETIDPYIGKKLNTPETLIKMRGDLNAAANELKAANVVDGNGQLLDMEIIALRPSPAAKDSVLLDTLLTLPGPINKVRNTVLAQ